MKIIALGLILTLLYWGLFQFLVSPYLDRWFPPSDLRALGTIKGNYGMLILYLILSWTVAAFYEELIFRGYLLNRLADLIGYGFWQQIVIIFLGAVPFGFIHAYQGPYGMIFAGLFALFQGLVYFKIKRLEIPMIAHGSFDTVGFVLKFLGY
jgi:membrane protease YdiL (CAAX protease family)